MATRLLCAFFVAVRVLSVVGKSETASVNEHKLELHERKEELMQELEAVEEGLASLGERWRNSCAKVGCHARYLARASCQCSSKCKKYDNCCSDYDDKCGQSADEAAGGEENGPEENATNYNETRPCLCAFDIDRTLTAGQREKCPSTTHQTEANIFDDAYGGGRLKLGEVGALSIAKTACRNCYTGIVSRGTAGGTNSQMRKYIMEHVIQTEVMKGLIADKKIVAGWSDWFVKCKRSLKTPFLVRSPNECKKYGVEAIRQLYAKAGVKIAKRDVFFFDDHSSNIPQFKKFGFNAFEIGCDSHKHSHTSRCGATNSEIRLQHLGKGFQMCKAYK